MPHITLFSNVSCSQSQGGERTKKDNIFCISYQQACLEYDKKNGGLEKLSFKKNENCEEQKRRVFLFKGWLPFAFFSAYFLKPVCHKQATIISWKYVE